jgi:hypothetical protein
MEEMIPGIKVYTEDKAQGKTYLCMFSYVQLHWIYDNRWNSIYIE